MNLFKNKNSIGLVHIDASFNNTKITLTDENGNTLAWSSAGAVGFKKSKRSTSYAAQVAGEDIGKKALEKGINFTKILVKGLGKGREASIKGLASTGVNVLVIKDTTPIPHNGCRNRKKRRI